MNSKIIEMGKRRTLVFVSIICLTLFFTSTAFGQELEKNEEITKLLLGENKREFYASQMDGGFASYFGNKEILSSHGNDIWIKPNQKFTMDHSSLLEYGTILIDGTLNIFETDEFPLKAQKIIVGPTGKLIIGTNKNPIDKNKNVEIILVKNQPGEIGIFNFGELTIHGYNIGPSFAELVSDAKPKATTFAINTVLKNWQRGSVILITSPGSNGDFENCDEENKIQRIDGVFIHLEEPLKCFHQGFNNNDDVISSHVVVLDRNVVIRSDDLKNRGSVNFFYGSQGYVKYGEFKDLGPKNVLARYPIHFHHMQDTSRGIEVEGNSVLNSDNRWITIHNSNGIVVKNNVGYKAIGHGFFLEDGTEFDNVFDHNIGIKTLRGNLISSDGSAAVFWSMNPLNSYTNNVAVDGYYYGFHFPIPNMIVYVPGLGHEANLRSLPNQEFENNIAYNNRVVGLKITRPLISDESVPSSTITISNLKVLSLFRNNFNTWGIFSNADDVIINNAKIFDSPIGIELRMDNNLVQSSRIIVTHNKDNILISGILLSGQNNIIDKSIVEGYIANKLSSPADVMISNSPSLMTPISAMIINSELRDSNPLYFGNPVNSQSYLEVYGYDAPNGPDNNYPENFVLQIIDRSNVNIEKNNIDLNFLATIKPINESKEKTIPNSKENFENQIIPNSKEEIIHQFQNKAIAWERDITSDNEFVAEVKVLIDEEIIKLTNVDLDHLDVIDFEIPNWVKQLVNHWIGNSITNQEFFNAIEFILQSQLANEYSSFEYN